MVGMDRISAQQKTIAEGHWHFITFGAFVCERMQSIDISALNFPDPTCADLLLADVKAYGDDAKKKKLTSASVIDVVGVNALCPDQELPAAEGKIADVPFERISLVDYDFIAGHEYTASLFQTSPQSSWSGEVYSGAKVTCWLQRKHEGVHSSSWFTQLWLTTLVLGVWSQEPGDSNRIGADFTRECAWACCCPFLF